MMTIASTVVWYIWKKEIRSSEFSLQGKKVFFPFLFSVPILSSLILQFSLHFLSPLIYPIVSHTKYIVFHLLPHSVIYRHTRSVWLLSSLLLLLILDGVLEMLSVFLNSLYLTFVFYSINLHCKLISNVRI